MSIPTLTVVGLYNFKDLYLGNNFEVSKLNIFAIILSFIFSFFTIKLFFNYIRKSSLTVFVIYRIFLGLVILFFSYT